MLRDVYGYDVVGEENFGEQAIKSAKKPNPDVVLMDVKMPGIGGLEATKTITQACDNTKVIALTGMANQLFAKQLIQAGASAYVTKEADFDEIVTAIEVVLEGKKYLSSALAQQLALRDSRSENTSPFEQLSERELQTAMKIVEGEKAISIAKSLSVSPKTINSYRYRIFSKLNISSDVELTLLAVKHNLIEGDPSI